MASRVRNVGKQVLLDDAHFADAVSPEVAQLIVIAVRELTTNVILTDDERRVIEGILE